MHSINSAFRVLEAMLPSPRKFGLLKKPSKADILRHAIIYIDNLQCIVNDDKSEKSQIQKVRGSITFQKENQFGFSVLQRASNNDELAECKVEDTENPSNYDNDNILYPCEYQRPNHCMNFNDFK